MRGRAGPVKAITDRIAIHLESRPAALQFAAAIDRWPTDAPDVPHAERHERASRLLAYAHTSRDLTLIERWHEDDPQLRGPEIVAELSKIRRGTRRNDGSRSTRR